MKKIFSYILIISLSALAIFQTYLLWNDFGEHVDRFGSKEDFKSEDLVRRVMSPRCIIVNKNGAHFQEYKTDEIFKRELPNMSKIFTNTTLKDYEEIDDKKYMDYQNRDSVVFVMARFLNLDDFTEGMGFEKKSEGLDFKASEIYYGKDGNIIISNGKKHIILKNKIALEKMISPEEFETKNLIEAKNFYELYKIPKNILLPIGDYIYARNFSYHNMAESLTTEERSVLATRFLSRDIDFIKEIRDEEKDTYVFESQVLKIENIGKLLYEDLSYKRLEEISPMEKLINDLNFIVDKTGRTEGYYLQEIYDKDGLTKVTFEQREDGIPVIPLKDMFHFIEISNNKDKISSYKEWYKRPKKETDVVKYPHKMRKFEYIIGENLDKFGKQNVQDVINGVRSISLVYLLEDEANLKLGLKIRFEGKSYYIDLEKNRVKGVN